MKTLSLATLSMLFSSLTLSQSASAAGLFDIRVTNYGSHSEAEVNAIVAALEREVNSKLPNTDKADPYIKSVANTGVTAGAGVGVDYQSPFDLFIVGVQAGGAVDPGDGSLADVRKDVGQARGFGVQAAIMAGLNFKALGMGNIGFIDTGRLKGYIHFFKAGIDRDFKDTKADFDVTSFGFHAQYKLIEDRKLASGMFRWNGLDLTTGYRYASVDGGLTMKVDKSVTRDLSGSPATLNFDGTALADAKVSVSSIPIEASSSVRFLYFLSLFGGVGTDLSFGSAKGSGRLSDTTISTSGAASDVSATATFDYDAKKGPSFMNARYFLGAGIEMAALTPYAQFTHVLSNGTYGLNVGVKGFW